MDMLKVARLGKVVPRCWRLEERKEEVEVRPFDPQRRQAPWTMFSLIELFRNKRQQHQQEEDIQLELQIQRDIEDVFGEIFEEDEELKEQVSFTSPSFPFLLPVSAPLKLTFLSSFPGFGT